ncbi:MAG: sugar ABC transporter ATP-binding protein [Cyclobacteriaceae bacterium]
MLRVENISKRFPGVIALDQVSLEIEPGKVTAIIGENGAGKSTLMKILSGVYTSYDGRIFYKGQEIRFAGTKDAEKAGIAIIHQELNLIPYLSISENIFLGREILNKLGWLDKKKMHEKTLELLQSLKLFVNPNTPVYQLKVGQQQVVEIAKALLLDSEVIFMDEPTSAISDSEVEILFDIIRELKAKGKAIVYISHKLDELYKIGDVYIVLRDGKFIDSGDLQQINHDELIRKMVGREMLYTRKTPHTSSKPTILEIKDLWVDHPEKIGEKLIKNVSFELRAGEILGIFGLMGAGRTELLEAIFGLYPKKCSGETIIDGMQVNISKPGDAIDAGLALVPEDRKRDGILPGMDIQSNISITRLQSIEKMGLLSQVKEANLAKKYMDELKVKASSAQQEIQNLSGGNQQKVVLAKWLATHPKVLLLDEPTRGIDINAKNEIYKIILQLAQEGLGVVLVSSELPEIMSISDRILVMAEGKITAEFSTALTNEEAVLKAAIPKTI